MSALGHKRTSRHVRWASIISHIADIHQRGLQRRVSSFSLFGPAPVVSWGLLLQSLGHFRR